MDIRMMRDDYERFLKIAPEALQLEAFLQNIYTDKYCLHNFVKIRDINSLFITNEEQTQDVDYHQGIFIDVFPMDKLSLRGWVRHFLLPKEENRKSGHGASIIPDLKNRGSNAAKMI